MSLSKCVKTASFTFAFNCVMSSASVKILSPSARASNPPSGDSSTKKIISVSFFIVVIYGFPRNYFEVLKLTMDSFQCLAFTQAVLLLSHVRVIIVLSSLVDK